jgi:long-chain acyl-CoA synthetase
MLNLAVLLDDSARVVPERTALVCEGTRLSYAQLNAAANQVANGLVQAGIRQGDTVGLSCSNVPYFSIVYYGILKAGINAQKRPPKRCAILVPHRVVAHLRRIARSKL